MQRQRTSVWIDGIQRHLEDLKENAYEGASGADRRAHYVAAFELLTPIAVDVLQQVNASLLRGTGDVSVRAPGPDGDGGLIGSWLISAVFPPGFTNPHLVAGASVDPRAASLAAWPMQVTSREDAEQQRPVLWAIATAEVHDRIYQSSWRVIPI